MIYPEKIQAPTEVATHYNSLDEFYRKLWGEHIHHGLWKTGKESVEEATVALIELVAESAKLQEGEEVCDVGCGYGGTSRYLATHFGASVTGLTLSQAQIDFAKIQTPDSSNPRYILGDFLDESLPAEHFDLVLSIESSEHMADKPAFFQEISRILKPGGRFVTCAWLSKEKPKAWEVKHLLEPICREGRLPSMGTPKDYERMMLDADLLPMSYTDFSKQAKKTWSICIRRTLRAFLTDKELRSYILDASSSDRVFAKTLFRLSLAYNTGSMIYGLFTAIKEA